jgi:hypothetical protein
MNKALSMLFCLCLALSTATAAFANMQSFKHFTVDVPQGWDAAEDGEVVSILAPGHTAAISIAVDSAEGMTTENLAKAMSTQLKGSAPVAADAGGFAFTFKNQSGVESKSTLFVNNNQYVMITVTGSHPDVPRILQSLKDK